MIKIITSSFYALAGSFIIVAGWNWYHLSKHEHSRFVLISLLMWVGICLGFCATKFIFIYFTKRFGRHQYWYNTFAHFLNELWFISSLIFLVFFSKDELMSLGFVSLIFLLLFWRLHRALAQHPEPKDWLGIHKALFSLAYFIFLVEALAQYFAYHYYILDANIRFYNIVFFRAWAMTMFWMFGFMLASVMYASLKSWLRYSLLVVWMLAFVGGLGFWMVNIGILYFSGLYFSPVALEHMTGAGEVAGNSVTIVLGIVALVVTILFILIMRRVLRLHQATERRYWWFYNTAIGLIAVGSLVSLTSFKNTPEQVVAKSFYDYFRGETERASLDPMTQKKLERFGLFYHPGQFYVAEKGNVFSTTTPPLAGLPSQPLLPKKFLINKPNVLIIFLESFSARLADVYNTRYTDLTPGLDRMAVDPHTTIFKNYYNASTPTITGTLSQLCSFLPPTGHNEIQNERKLQNHHLLCLPEVLKKQAGFKYASYITAVDKEFAHKDGIFTSAGVDKIFGTGELKKYIAGEPLSWGYSDHQLFPATWNFMQAAADDGKEPWLMMLATVDTHPPFNLPKDAVNYGDGKQPVLNMFHTTDDAFGKFWDTFKQSPFYQNTIVITVADHAIFPGALTKDVLEWPGNPDTQSARTFYDQNLFMMYIPDSTLPKTVDTFSSGLDLTPTLLQIFNINIPNSFEGHSIFSDRTKYPNLLGMHELGLYINQLDKNGKRTIDYNVPSHLECDNGAERQLSSRASASRLGEGDESMDPLTLCEYLQFYKWKRAMFEEGKFWKR